MSLNELNLGDYYVEPAEEIVGEIEKIELSEGSKDYLKELGDFVNWLITEKLQKNNQGLYRTFQEIKNNIFTISQENYSNGTDKVDGNYGGIEIRFAGEDDNNSIYLSENDSLKGIKFTEAVFRVLVKLINMNGFPFNPSEAEAGYMSTLNASLGYKWVKRATHLGIYIGELRLNLLDNNLGMQVLDEGKKIDFLDPKLDIIFKHFASSDPSNANEKNTTYYGHINGKALSLPPAQFSVLQCICNAFPKACDIQNSHREAAIKLQKFLPKGYIKPMQARNRWKLCIPSEDTNGTKFPLPKSKIASLDADFDISNFTK